MTITSKYTERQSDSETSKWLTGRLLLAVNELRINSCLVVVLECFLLLMFCFADYTDYTCSEYLSKTLERLIEVFLVYLMFTLNRYLPIGN